MSKILDIIKSGKAPGIRCGQEPFDETTVYSKVPKALKEVENEPLFKHGPARGASRIAKSFGMSTDTIRREWSKPVPLILFILCLLTFSAKAGDITSGISVQDGQTINAAQLMNLVNLATINSQFISAKPIDPTPLTSDTFILYSPTLNGLYRITLGSAVLSNTNLITTQTEKTAPVSGDYLLMLDSVTGTFAKVSIGNLVLNNTNVVFGGPFIVQTNLDPQLVVPIRNFGTNGTTTVSNIFYSQFALALTNYPVITAPTNTDFLLIWSTRTNANNPGGTNPFVAVIAPQNVGPYTIVITNIPTTNFHSATASAPMLNTNVPGLAFPPEVRVSLVLVNSGNTTLNNAGYQTPGIEIDALKVLNSSNAPAYMMSQYPDGGVIVAGVFATNTISAAIQVPYLVSTNLGRGYFTTDPNNFTLKVYITPQHGQ